MSDVQGLLTEHLDIWTTAESGKKSGRGRSSGNGETVYGVKKLRELILELAVRGKLVPQDPKDEPASVLVKRIQEEKTKSVASRRLKRTKPSPVFGDNIQPFELPKGWEWVRFPDIGEFGRGKSKHRPRNDPHLFNPGLYPLVQTGEVARAGSYIKEYHSKYSRAGLAQSKMWPKGTLCITIAANIADSALLGFEACFPDSVVGFVPTKPIETAEYFLYFMKTARESLLRFAPATAQKNINLEILESVLIPLPPLAEQNRIVAKVDELMALCDQLEAQHNNAADAHEKLVTHLLGTLTQSQDAADFNANWQRIAEHFDTLFTTEHSIDTLKQTLLQLAVMGKLVPQDPNDEPASELLKRIQAEKAKLIAEGKIKKEKPLPPISDEEKPFALPVGWEWARMQTIIDVRDGTHDSPKYVEGDNTYPLVTSKDFQDGEIDFNGAKRISESDYLEISKRSLVEEDDILFSMIGGNIGNQVMVKVKTHFAIKNVALFKYYNKEMTFPLFMKIKTEELAGILQLNAVGGAQPFVSLGMLRSIVIALPPVKEQKRIVNKVSELKLLCDHLKSRIIDSTQLKQKLADALVEQALH